MRSHHWLLLIGLFIAGYFVGVYWPKGAAMLKLPGIGGSAG